MKELLRAWGLAVAVAIGALALVVAGLAIAGWPAGAVVRQWALGAIGGKAELAASLREACPLLLTGLAAGIAFRSGVLNIGAEGQFVWGQVMAVGLATAWAPAGAPGWIVALVAIGGGTLAGSVWAGVAAMLERYRGVPVVLSTILLNFVALYAVGILLLGPLQLPGTGAPQSQTVAEAYRLPVLVHGTQLHIGVLVAFALAGIAWLTQARTTFGFELLVTGLNPAAAELAGMPVGWCRATVLLLSGAFAGFGGALEVLGVTHSLSNVPPGYGYAGIAVAMLGRLHPAGIAAAALFFAMLDTGARHVEKDFTLTIPHATADAVKGVVILAMLVGTAWIARRRTMQAGN